jgi:hypothetical protein
MLRENLTLMPWHNDYVLIVGAASTKGHPREEQHTWVAHTGPFNPAGRATPVGGFAQLQNSHRTPDKASGSNHRRDD